MRAAPIHVVRIISRLNVGGPAIQAITLTKELEPLGYHTTLIRGREDSAEGNMDYLAERIGVHPVLIRSLRRSLGRHDLRALPALVAILRMEQPRIIHTHAAKAGALGRLAALLAFRGRRRPVLVHTFHGHSLTGYFSSGSNAAFLRIERFLAQKTDRLIAVSGEVRDDLVALGVARREQFDVIPVGFDLRPFLIDGRVRAERRAALRAELGIAPEARVVSLIARLVPIKRVDRFLRLANALSEVPLVRFVIVGDGELREELRASSKARALGDRLVWTGFRRDVSDVYFASDVVVLTSDNEGTPVSLIEAQAAGVPVVSTAVGGVASVVRDQESGRVAPPRDEHALVQAVRDILTDGLGASMGARGREHAIANFSLDRLVTDIASLYRDLVERASSSGDGDTQPNRAAYLAR